MGYIGIKCTQIYKFSSSNMLQRCCFLPIKPLVFCASCEKFLLEENKIMKMKLEKNLSAVVNLIAGTITNVTQLHAFMRVPVNRGTT